MEKHYTQQQQVCWKEMTVWGQAAVHPHHACAGGSQAAKTKWALQRHPVAERKAGCAALQSSRQ
jgi:hypothetical protein